MSAVTFELLIDGEVRRVLVESRDGTIILREGGHTLEAEVRRISAHELKLRLAGRPVRIFLARDGERSFVAVDGRQYAVSGSCARPDRPGAAADTTDAGSLRIKSPMPGKVTKVAVSEGDVVRRNQTLVIVEAMKMENEIKSSIDGTVDRVHAAVGDLVDAERILVEIEPRAA